MWLAIIAAAGIFVDYVMGTVVTNTGSGTGCGRTWPLCQGKFIPELAVKTAIEFSHRAVTGIVSVLALAVVIGALVFWRQRREIQVLAPLMAGILVIEAILGGIIAVYPKSPVVLALHFGSSLVTIGSFFLVAVVLYELNGAEAVRDRPLPRGFAWAVWGLIALMYLVGYLGAYIGHADIGLACPDWPLCQGSLLPSLAGAAGLARGLVLVHRYAAFVLVLATVALFLWARRVRRGRPDLYRGALAALVLIVLQGLAGGFLVGSHLSLFARLAHAGLVALYFAALSYLALHVLPRPKGVRTPLVRKPARAEQPQAGTTPRTSATPAR